MSDDLDLPMERGHAALSAWLELDPGLRAEFEASAREFFGATGVPADQDARLARRRQLEWFALERESGHLGGVPIQVLSEHPDAAARGLGAAEAAAWIGSFAGVFEVTGVRPTEGLWLRDLAGSGEYPLAEQLASAVLASGDLVAGRLFPVGDALYRLSPAAVFLRDESLLAALRNDFERARERRRGVLRIAQDEIERLFHARRASEPAQDPVELLRARLLRGGLSAGDIEEIVQDLASQPCDADDVAPGSGDLVGAILDQLAFETDIDLDEAREALLVAWRHLSEAGPGRGASLRPQPPPRAKGTAKATRSADVQRALADFDRARAAGMPVEQSFDELERALELENLGSDEDDLQAPDFPGAVAAIVDEFVWELERTEGARAAEACAPLRDLGRFAQPIGVPENLDRRAIVDFAARWCIDEDVLTSADQARLLVAALERFRRWAQETQAILQEPDLERDLELLASELPRVVEVNRRRTRRAAPSEGELFELVGRERDRVLVRNDGAELALEIDPLPLEWVRPGDILRGRAASGRLALYACYPNLSAGRVPAED